MKSIIEKITPKPSEFKSQFKKYGVPVAATAHYLGLNYSYVSNLLNGLARMTPRVSAKLQSLLDQLESEESNGRLGEN